jgi:hypothetical protein
MGGPTHDDKTATKGIHPTLEGLRVVHYLLYERDDNHVAHCLDLDVVAVGSSIEEASQKLDFLVKAHIEYALKEGREDALRIQAPTDFWRQFFSGKNLDLEPRTIHIQVPEGGQVVPRKACEEVGIVARQPVHAA